MTACLLSKVGVWTSPRRDTPRLVAQMQNEVFGILAEAHDFESYCVKLTEARDVLNRCLERIAKGDVKPEELVITKRLTRPPWTVFEHALPPTIKRLLQRNFKVCPF